MRTFLGIPEPRIETIKYDIKKFMGGSVITLFMKANIILYFVFMLEKILGKYL